MRGIVIGSIVFALAAASQPAAAQPPAPQKAPPQQKAQRTHTTTMAAEATLKEIQQAFGFIPQFFRAIPAPMLEGFWSGMYQFESSEDTALDPKVKELIGIAVAAQIPCEYCLYFHKMGARAHGATDAEIKEAVGMAAMTRMGSTLLNGMEVDKAQFRKDVDRVMRKVKQHAQATPSPRTRTRP